MLRRVVTGVAVVAVFAAGVVIAMQGSSGQDGVLVVPDERPLVATVGGPNAAELAPAVHAVLGGADPVVLSDAGLYNPVVAPVFDADGRIHLPATWEQLGALPEFEVVVLTADWVRPQLACTAWAGCANEADAAEFARGWAREAAGFWTAMGVDVVWVGWLPYGTDPAAAAVSWPSTVVNGWFAEGLEDLDGSGSVVFVDVETGLADSAGDMLVEGSDGEPLRTVDGGVCPAAAVLVAERVGFATVAGWPGTAPVGWDDPDRWQVWPAARAVGAEFPAGCTR